MNDSSQSDGASIEQLRQHFRARVSSQDFAGQMAWPESYRFMVVDKDVLDKIRPLDSELEFLPWEHQFYVKAIDRDCPCEDEDYPGWMRFSLASVFNVYQMALDHQNMRGLRSRHTDWYRGRTPEEETFLEEEDESESSLSWASDSEVEVQVSAILRAGQGRMQWGDTTIALWIRL